MDISRLSFTDIKEVATACADNAAKDLAHIFTHDNMSVHNKRNACRRYIADSDFLAACDMLERKARNVHPPSF